MNVAQKKTQALRREEIDIDLLDPNPDNPNEMSDAEFNLLYDNFEKTGITDPVLVRALPNGRFRIVGGHHRVEVAKLHGFKKVPCTIIDDPEFDEDQEKFQVVRMNVIRGRMTPERFMKMYESVAEKYGHEVLKDAFGFADEAEFKKMVKQVKASLPPEAKKAFEKAAKDIKTVEELSKVLNRLMTDHGDTLKWGYMVFDHGGKDSVWLRSSKETLNALYGIGEVCREKQRSMDALVGGLLQLIANGQAPDLLQKVIDSTQPVEIPDDAVEMPTEDFLSKLGD